MGEFGGIHHLSLSVRSLSVSLTWYAAVLGLEKTFERTDEQQGWSKGGLRDPDTGMRIHFTEHRAGSGDAFDERRTGLDHVAIQVNGGRAALERWVSRLDEHGVTHSGVKRGGSGDLITFRDPDNIQLEVYTTDA